MRILVTGVNGQLGHDVMLELERRGHRAIGSGSGEAYSGSDTVAQMPYVQMDITDSEAVSRVFFSVHPHAVIHCSAWTAVDAAEKPENREIVFAFNVKGSENIAAACAGMGAKMVYISTDYVFNGRGSRPWRSDDAPGTPLNVYGESKLAGETVVRQTLRQSFIVRTSWLFGSNGRNFVKTMLNVGRTHSTVRVVNDQIGTPTYTHDLSRLLVDMIETEKYGTYHAANGGGYLSWYDFAREIFCQTHLAVQVIPISSAELDISRTHRPLNSRLDQAGLREAGFDPLPDWHDALCRYLSEIGERENGTNQGDV